MNPTMEITLLISYHWILHKNLREQTPKIIILKPI